ncbi:MAG: prepilin-type N-terminal cleavage/methylation domain-containing protein [Clostridia bacterium]
MISSQIKIKGFTLIEVSISLLVFSLLAASVLQVFFVSRQQGDLAMYRQIASYLAFGVMEELSYDQASNNQELLPVEMSSDSQTVNGIIFQIATDIQEASAGLQLWSVVVSYDYKGEIMEYELSKEVSDKHE